MVEPDELAVGVEQDGDAVEAQVGAVRAVGDSVSQAIAIRRTLDCLRSWRFSHGSRAPERRVLTSTKTSVCAVEDDEVELAEARPVVAGEDLEAEALEVLGGELLAAAGPRCAGRRSWPRDAMAGR